MNLRWRLDQAGYVSSGAPCSSKRWKRSTARITQGTKKRRMVPSRRGFGRRNFAPLTSGVSRIRRRRSSSPWRTVKAANVYAPPSRAQRTWTVSFTRIRRGEPSRVRRVHDARRRRHEMDAREGQHHTSRHAAGGGDAQSEESVREGEVHGTRGRGRGRRRRPKHPRPRPRPSAAATPVRTPAKSSPAGGKKTAGGVSSSPRRAAREEGRDEKGNGEGKGGRSSSSKWKSSRNYCRDAVVETQSTPRLHSSVFLRT